MRMLAVALLFAAGAAQAAGLVEISPDAKGGPVVGNAGGNPVTRPITAFGVDAINLDPPKQEEPKEPPKTKAGDAPK